jgi:hypothetical protein
LLLPACFALSGKHAASTTAQCYLHLCRLYSMLACLNAHVTNPACMVSALAVHVQGAQRCKQRLVLCAAGPGTSPTSRASMRTPRMPCSGSSRCADAAHHTCCGTLPALRQQRHHCCWLVALALSNWHGASVCKAASAHGHKQERPCQAWQRGPAHPCLPTGIMRTCVSVNRLSNVAVLLLAGRDCSFESAAGSQAGHRRRSRCSRGAGELGCDSMRTSFNCSCQPVPHSRQQKCC